MRTCRLIFALLRKQLRGTMAQQVVQLALRNSHDIALMK